ncbi:hypothetical protein LZ496_08820 [Sphingomonas sp. NSE70-1]|uniref:Uncharacterized protein n=1 Tax=Sphingomonas caseinilyticus TaxID=2908205 RepID=A0ABT0RW07_9SPHN|nr:hypothetical protein [Sphingomonas caseinilyticus]MCL6698880.1 hypothetical protein [Sphingomonas caseinilyticus]
MIGWMAMAAAILAQAGRAEQQPLPETVVAVSPVPMAAVSGNVITHPVEKIRIRVPEKAIYAGAERFNLYGVADAEIHVFVEADAAKKMQRLYWVQFESYLPSNDHRYNYAEGNTRFDLWGGTPTWLVWGPRLSSAPYRAGGDRESVMRILSRAGYTIPPEVLNVRMVQMLDDPAGTGRGRRELMIIYSEDLAPSGKTVAELAVDGKVNEAFKPLERPLIDRATTSVSVERF